MSRLKFAALTLFGLLISFAAKPSQAQWAFGDYVVTEQYVFPTDAKNAAAYDCTTPSEWAITTTGDGGAYVTAHYTRKATWQGSPATAPHTVTVRATGSLTFYAALYASDSCGCTGDIGSFVYGTFTATPADPFPPYFTSSNYRSVPISNAYYGFTAYSGDFVMHVQADGDEGYITGVGSIILL